MSERVIVDLTNGHPTPRVYELTVDEKTVLWERLQIEKLLRRSEMYETLERPTVQELMDSGVFSPDEAAEAQAYCDDWSLEEQLASHEKTKQWCSALEKILGDWEPADPAFRIVFDSNALVMDEKPERNPHVSVARSLYEDGII